MASAMFTVPSPFTSDAAGQNANKQSLGIGTFDPLEPHPAGFSGFLPHRCGRVASVPKRNLQRAKSKPSSGLNIPARANTSRKLVTALR